MRLLPKHPLEALLRPPVELWSSAILTLLAISIVWRPGTFLLDSTIAFGVAGVLVSGAGFRAAQGVHLLRYQRNIKYTPAWSLDFGSIPHTPSTLFLGRGFLWTAQHTQRLRETQTPSGRKYMLTKNDVASTQADGVSGSGRPEIHGVDLHEQLVLMHRADRVGHTLVLGTTRVGKTRLAELLITQDIQRDEVVIVFDPKGDADLLCRMVAEARRSDRVADMLVFHLGHPTNSCRYNAIGRFSRITEVATRIANQLPDSGNSAAFKEFAWRFVNIITGALVALKRTPNFRLVRRYINDIEPLFVEYARFFLHRNAPAGWSKLVRQRMETFKTRGLPAALRGRDVEAVALLKYAETLDLYDPVFDGLVSAYKYDRTYFDKIVSSVGPLMEKLTTGAVADLVSPEEGEDDDPRPILDWLEVIEQRRIVYVGLDSLSDTTVASAIGNAMFADLVSVAGYIYNFGVDGSASSQRIALHADEFNELIGEEFVPLLNKAGGAGFQVTAYTQTWSDVEAQIGSRAKAGQVAGNFNSLIMLRVRELATAKMLVDQLPRVGIVGKSTSSGAGDSSKADSEIDFETNHADSLSKSDAPLVGPTELFTLPRGQAFALLDGGRLWKLRFPIPDPNDRFLPDSIEDAFAILRASSESIDVRETVGIEDSNEADLTTTSEV
ncbi:MAG: type IV conjugative transfer system coupling protein TraD [Gammaproteobacteria bacterium]|nr:type IV conjugative transfer system coupling protein TraD [Gammaproteobacteria bacterium]